MQVREGAGDSSGNKLVASTPHTLNVKGSSFHFPELIQAIPVDDWTI